MDPSDDESDLITLGELTEYSNSLWKFPDTTRCPLRSCKLKLRSRKKAIEHYRKKHADHAVLCELCNIPLMLMLGTHHLNGHFRRKHPEEPLPKKIKSIEAKCLKCNALFKNYATLHAHIKNVHRKKALPKSGKLKNKMHSFTNDGNKRKFLTHSNTSESSKENFVRESGSKSPSWEDFSDNSGDGFSNVNEHIEPNAAACKASNKSLLERKLRKKKKTNQLRQLVKRKARLFKLRQKLRPCTICGTHLPNYGVACNHYRLAHGRTVSMCPFCKKYFLKPMALLQHIDTLHQYRNVNKRKTPKPMPRNSAKNVENEQIEEKMDDANLSFDSLGEMSDLLGFDTDKENCSQSNPVEKMKDASNTVGPSVEQDQTLSENSHDEDDYVTIGHLTEYKIVHWRFPNTNTCPRSFCSKKFKNRAEAKQHYIKMHADYDMSCQECGKIIALSGAHNLLNHYNRKHPNIDPPPKVFENNLECEFCSKVLSSSQLRIHKQTQHSKEMEAQYALNRRQIIKRSNRISARSKSIQSKGSKSSSASKLAAKKVCTPVVIDLTNIHDTTTVPNDPNRAKHSKSAPKTDSLTKTSKISQKQFLEKDGTKSMDETASVCESNCSSPTKHNTRTTRVPNKACTICGQILMNYRIACEHYSRNHGRNVLMCPYCEQYFLLSNLLTKHVLALHPEDEIQSKSTKDDLYENGKSKGTNIKDHTNETVKDSETVRQEPIKTTQAVQDQPVESIATIEDDIPYDLTQYSGIKSNSVDQPHNEPLNLCISDNNDLTDGPLDLSMNK